MATTRDKSSLLAASLQRQLYQLVRAYELCNQACLSQNGVTASQGYTLLFLPEQGYLTMNDLSEAMGLASSTMTRYVDGLVRQGLAHRGSDDEDRRVVRVGLTERGQALRRVLLDALQDFFEQVMAEIQEKDRPVIMRVLEQVTNAIAKVFKSCCAA